jgi:hypothetical protein
MRRRQIILAWSDRKILHVPSFQVQKGFYKDFFSLIDLKVQIQETNRGCVLLYMYVSMHIYINMA